MQHENPVEKTCQDPLPPFQAWNGYTEYSRVHSKPLKIFNHDVPIELLPMGHIPHLLTVNGSCNRKKERKQSGVESEAEELTQIGNSLHTGPKRGLLDNRA